MVTYYRFSLGNDDDGDDDDDDEWSKHHLTRAGAADSVEEHLYKQDQSDVTGACVVFVAGENRP